MTEEQRTMTYYQNKADEVGVPPHLIDGIIRYIIHGIEPGGCSVAIFANDLMEAFGRADQETAYSMKHICTFIYSYAPAACHGSYEKVAKWMEAVRAANKSDAAVEE